MTPDTARSQIPVEPWPERSKEINGDRPALASVDLHGDLLPSDKRPLKTKRRKTLPRQMWLFDLNPGAK